jgi:hypothetical protein
MQQVRSNREPLHESIIREDEVPIVVRTELSSVVNNYADSQRHCKKLFLLPN